MSGRAVGDTGRPSRHERLGNGAAIAKRSILAFLLTLGSVFLLMLILACTPIPFKAHRQLAVAGGLCRGTADVVVVLGGSGMPSGPELLRLHHAATMPGLPASARYFVVHPQDTLVMEDMIAELVLKGVDRDRIFPVYEGTNTREQALEVARVVQGATTMAVVTAPENMYRTLAAFRKAGSQEVCGAPAFDHAMFIDLDYDHRRIGGRRIVPDVSSSNALRYDLWNNLKLEITCMREYAAIAYYWINGWI